MDTTPQYVQMCKSAHPLQDLRGDTFNYGDYIACQPPNGTFETRLYTGNIKISKGEYWWLPMQDQLQQLWYNKFALPDVECKDNPTIFVLHLHRYVNHVLIRNLTALELPFKTMEQWQLAMLMEAVYSRRWQSASHTWELIR